MVKVLAAIPCFNTEPYIADVVARTRQFVYQVVVINDGSQDGTVEAARAAGAQIVDHQGNRGYGESIRSCFEAALANRADILVTLDGDGQHSPEEIPQVLAPLLSGEADMVIGSRFLCPQGNMPRYREFGIRVIGFLFNLGARAKVSDAQSGFRAYRRRVLEGLSLTHWGMSVSVEILVKARERGFVIKEVPIRCLYHSGGSTLNPLSHGLGVALAVLKLRLSVEWLGGAGRRGSLAAPP